MSFSTSFMTWYMMNHLDTSWNSSQNELNIISVCSWSLFYHWVCFPYVSTKLLWRFCWVNRRWLWWRSWYRCCSVHIWHRVVPEVAVARAVSARRRYWAIVRFSTFLVHLYHCINLEWKYTFINVDIAD